MRLPRCCFSNPLWYSSLVSIQAIPHIRRVLSAGELYELGRSYRNRTYLVSWSQTRRHALRPNSVGTRSRFCPSATAISERRPTIRRIELILVAPESFAIPTPGLQPGALLSELQGHGTGVRSRTLSRSFGGCYVPQRHRYVLKNPRWIAGGKALWYLKSALPCPDLPVFKLLKHTHTRARGRVGEVIQLVQNDNHDVSIPNLPRVASLLLPALHYAFDCFLGALNRG